MIDLSRPIYEGMPVYPGDPEVRLREALTIERDGAAVTEVRAGSHTGTHVDAPAHVVPGGRTLDRVSLEELSGDALVIHVAAWLDPAADEALDESALRLDALEAVPPIVLVRTGWAGRFGSAAYLQHPFLTRGAAARLIDLGMHVLGVDALSPDRSSDQAAGSSLPVHELVLGADGLIVENLRGLELLGERARVGLFPLALDGTDGAPVRAVAFEAGDERR